MCHGLRGPANLGDGVAGDTPWCREVRGPAPGAPVGDRHDTLRLDAANLVSHVGRYPTDGVRTPRGIHEHTHRRAARHRVPDLRLQPLPRRRRRRHQRRRLRGARALWPTVPSGSRSSSNWIDEHVNGKPYGVDFAMPVNYVGKGGGEDASFEALDAMIPQEHREFVDELPGPLRRAAELPEDDGGRAGGRRRPRGRRDGPQPGRGLPRAPEREDDRQRPRPAPAVRRGAGPRGRAAGRRPRRLEGARRAPGRASAST